MMAGPPAVFIILPDRQFGPAGAVRRPQGLSILLNCAFSALDERTGGGIPRPTADGRRDPRPTIVPGSRYTWRSPGPIDTYRLTTVGVPAIAVIGARYAIKSTSGWVTRR